MLLLLQNAGPLPPITAPQHVQNTGNVESTASATAHTLPNIVAGNTLIATIQKTSSTAATWTISDTKGATWTQRVRIENLGRSFEIWSTHNATGGHRTITITQDGSYIAYRSTVIEITGADFDVASSLLNDSSTTQHCSASASVIDTAADVFVVAGATSNAPVTAPMTPDANYTAIIADPTKPALVCYRNSNSALVNERASFTIGSASGFRAAIASFTDNGLGGLPADPVAGTVTQDSKGWTNVVPASDSVLFYVSTSGSDANDGFTSETPKATIGAACALLRSGKPDHILLKRGDTFTNAQFTAYTTGPQGRSAQEPWLFGAYGTGERPKVSATVSTDAVSFTANGVKYLVIQSIEFFPTYRGAGASNDTDGITIVGPTTQVDGVLIEDCYVRGFSTNINVKNGANVTIRRNIIADAWCDSSIAHSQGIYSTDVVGITIEENLFDHNGWNYDGSSNGGATIFNHNAYLSFGVRDVVWRRNFSSRASSYGLKCQPSDGLVSVITNCHDKYGGIAQTGLSESSTGNTGQGMVVTIEDNVAVEGNATGAPGNNGLGWTLQNIESGTFSRNIFCNRLAPGLIGHVVQMTDGPDANSYGVHDLTLGSNVVYDWRGPIRVLDGATYDHSGIVFTSNELQEPTGAGKPLLDVSSASSSINSFSGQKYHTNESSASRFKINSLNKSFAQWDAETDDTGSTETQVSYTAPTRTTTTYAASLGFYDWDAFIAAARGKRRGTGNVGWLAEAVNDYIRAGFDKSALGVTGNWQNDQLGGGASKVAIITQLAHAG